MFNRTNLKKYLLMSFAAVLILTTVLTGASIFGLFQTKSMNNDYITTNVAASNAIKDIRYAAHTIASDVREMTFTSDKDRFNDMMDEIPVFQESIKTNLDTLKKVMGEDNEIIVEYDKVLSAWTETAEDVVAALKAGDMDEAESLIIKECSPTLVTMASVEESLDANIGQMRTESEQDSDTTYQIVLVAVIVLYILIMIVALVIAFKATRNITDTLKKFKEATDNLSQGILSERVDYDGENEFAELAGNMNFAFEELERYIEAIKIGMKSFAERNFNIEPPIEFKGEFTEIRKYIEEFRNSITKVIYMIEISAEQINVGASQVSEGSQALANGATQQASSVQELAATMNEIRNQAVATKEGAENARAQVSDASVEIVNCNEKMKNMLHAMDEIDARSKEIKKIMKTVEDIAFQTNILALNASVEAARAGAAGKGFAVVANEVGELANKSAAASKDTAALIEETSKAIDTGIALAKETAESLVNIVEATQAVNNNMGDIANMAVVQADSVEQINIGIDQISSVVQVNSATSEESAAASEELSAQIAEMKNEISKFQIYKKILEEEGMY